MLNLNYKHSISQFLAIRHCVTHKLMKQEKKNHAIWCFCELENTAIYFDQKRQTFVTGSGSCTSTREEIKHPRAYAFTGNYNKSN